ncbi:hypothetical protein [Paenibacillus alvei]|uniref:hypothetical protein n=1 Tax=Paenibacillus alvei TaxID=44250 RepID=UPI0013DB45DC|nr:hypothetical protein [Paenibacillus alvei]NEZ40636.1 hypothetical protein [Paenibacillus alvei]
MKAKWLDYGEPAVAEAIGLYYAAFMFIGLALGMMKNGRSAWGGIEYNKLQLMWSQREPE